MQESTKQYLLIGGIAVLAGAVYLSSRAMKVQETGIKALTSNTATQLVKSSESVLNMPEKTAQVAIKETEKTLRKVGHLFQWKW